MRRPFSIPLPDGQTLTVGQRTLIVGVLNVTPDSFSDGGLHLDPARAIDRALQMQSEGADIVEVGGESTRPGARRLDESEELDRVLPVLKAVVSKLQAPVSIDTYKSAVAQVAVDAGVAIVNDVSALRFDAAVADVAARTGAALVLMHMRGTPETMQKLEPSTDIIPEIERDLSRSILLAERRGVKRKQIVIDPGVGFGKTLEQNLEIVNRLEEFEELGLPLMIGTSRKSFLGRLTGKPEDQRLFGTAASVAAAILRGAHFVRVHDVKEMAEVARVADAIAAQE